jgi:hypothetical protein
MQVDKGIGASDPADGRLGNGINMTAAQTQVNAEARTLQTDGE